jgi:hypothetical protein
MRCLAGFAWVLVVLVALPQSAPAQDADGAATSKRASARLRVHTRISLPPKFMLRASSYREPASSGLRRWPWRSQTADERLRYASGQR